MGLVLVTALVVVAVNLVVDLLQGFLNPKVRLS
jgi:peptide/nickel transport system permease protein